MRPSLLMLALFASACGGSSSPAPAPNTRILGMAVDVAEDDDFDAAADLAQSAGVQAFHTAFTWSDIETAPQVYGNPLLGVMDIYFPPRGLKINLTIQNINTVRREVPSDLETVPWDDPTMIARFNQMLDFLFAQIPNVELSELAIGNEVDGVLSGQAEYDEYRVFFEAARAHARTLRPGLRVGVTATFGGLVGPDATHLQALNTSADVISVTYYPLLPDFTVSDPSVVGADFDALVALYPGRTIVFQECGYPSSPDCNSSEVKQRDFVAAVFQAWDRHASQIDHISFFKQTDWSDATVDGFLVYYGVATPEFRGYLISLGMRTFAGAGTDKAAWTAFEQEAAARGW